jgi:hypothetical protein
MICQKQTAINCGASFLLCEINKVQLCQLLPHFLLPVIQQLSLAIYKTQIEYTRAFSLPCAFNVRKTAVLTAQQRT